MALTEVLDEFRAATDSAIEILPSGEQITAPENGITLLEAKNEIFLAYLQALALRNLSVIRSIRTGQDADSVQQLSHDLTKKLVEQRVYLERGVRVLEQKIKYQVDRVVKIAETEERKAASKTSKVANGNARPEAEDSEEEDSGDSSDEHDGDEDEDMTNFRPSLASMKRDQTARDSDQPGKERNTGVYRPPRVSATTMPEVDRREKQERKPGKSRTLDEYVATELSTAPLLQPSIGSNIAAGGRNNKGSRQLRDEAERRAYEETNLVRLPAMSRKEAAMKGYRQDKDGGFGGEEWRDLGRSVERIGDLTRKRTKDSVADKSRKRRAVEDGPRGDGVAPMGSKFEIKKRRMTQKGRI